MPRDSIEDTTDSKLSPARYWENTHFHGLAGELAKPYEMSKYKKPLTEEELLHCLENDEESDVPLLSDEDDIEDQNSVHDDDIFAALNAEDDSQNTDDDVENMELDETHMEGPNENGTEPEEVGVTLKQEIEEFQKEYGLTEKSKIKWMNNVVYETRNIDWYEPPPLDPVIEMPPPIHFFMKYIPEEIMQQMVDMTNLYSIQKNIPRFCPTKLEEIKKFIGVPIAIGNLQFPRVRMYWSPKYGIPLIKDSISLHRFFKLRQAVHLVDITGRPENNTDILWKVRDIYDSIRRRCQELPLETNLCVDEQIVPFKGQLNIKQYIKNKPKKWGIKIYVMAGQSGTIYDFFIYQGSTTEIKPVYKHYGSAAGVVMQLTERINDKNHGLYFDNYFSNYHLFQFLQAKSIFAVGTVRMNRFSNPKLPTDKELRAKGRGTSSITLSKDGIILTEWYDNKSVITASNFIGVGKESNCTRWDKTTKRYLQIPRPEAIKLYNENMGGVDKVNFLLSMYRSSIRSRKWTVRMICHAIDLALVNSWLEYKQKAVALGIQRKKIMDLLAFRESVAEHLILFMSPPKRGRPSSDINSPIPVKKKV
ncbi:hypothetical protein JTB14_025142 [Gonioctena quinquepunctata]|nr:hypothetical protein JTB14_025142 [Gonioctena quinquepunctata]